MRLLHFAVWIVVSLVGLIFVVLPLALVAVAGMVLGLVGVGAATLAAMVARSLKVLAPVLLVVAFAGCAAREDRVDRFEHWTRYYEARMGLPVHEIRIGPAPGGACEWTGMELHLGRRGLEAAGPVIVYDPDRKGCRPPEALALHACCHVRMAHPFLSEENRRAMGVDPEAEAKTCETWYGPPRSL